MDELLQENALGDVETIANRLDVVLVTALRENFEIKEGFHMDRNEMLEFLQSVVQQHADLGFVLHHRDTKLSGRIYKAFPKVTTKRVAVPTERGKKIWRYTNLRRTVPLSEFEKNLAIEGDSATNVKIETTESSYNVAEEEKNEEKRTNNGNGSASTEYHHDSSSLEVTQDFEPTTDLKFRPVLKWIKDNYMLDNDSTIQVKYIVEGIKEAFNMDITYKQSHKLVFSVFPGASSRLAHHVRLELSGSFYSYRGIGPKEQPSKRLKTGRSKQTWVPPFEKEQNGESNSVKQTRQKKESRKSKVLQIRPKKESEKSKVTQSRKRFLESCAVLKDNLDVLHSMRSHEAVPVVPELAAMEKESTWQRMVEELKQERDQAIMERNQAMISLMELENQTESRSNDITARPLPAACHKDDVISVAGRPVTPQQKEEAWPESRDWLRSLINRSNHILGEQMSEANSKYFPRLTLQTSSSPNQTKQTRGPPGEFIEMDRYEKLKNERDNIWKNWLEKMKREKEDIIQQLNLEKMEVIQKMELEKSDALDSVEEKLSNQVTILTRELRELKELLNHTMNERMLAIEHARKLMKLVDEKILKEQGLDSFPFDEIEEHRSRQTFSDESVNQKAPFPTVKGNKRKQSMPAKLKKLQKTCQSASTSLVGVKSDETGNDCCEKPVETGDNREKYYSETLSCCDEQNNLNGNSVSSIDWLNSIVEKIGRPDIGESPRKTFGKSVGNL